ncbi:EAL domain-containing protein [Methylophaga sulfidovorans]|uniref:PAS domain S-box-containing protein/diguanylate cyclase (GGDEF) domain-containing protein n=1 Tax=Methylophaga sulfidovorans TaxID=45496 RepID=A0A1I3WHP3_9GAMM|nr:EAL domain-containing protein [Methylophaga sulfidovorans]SFK06699.1 PAS domain S-box-containing protein/diguanylate cyclase (GGDEF) domain-containing protein [Methylophaga sulfidovorans]
MYTNTYTRMAFYSILAVLAVIFISIATIISRHIDDNYKAEQFVDTQALLNKYQSRINSELQGHIQLVRGLPSLFAVNPQLSQQQFAMAVSYLVESDTEIRNIAAAPDMVIRYIYPIAGNVQALGLDYRKEPAQFEAADRARRTRELVLAGPVQLKQGGMGLITRIPVFLNDEATGEEYFWGLISAVIDVDKFFNKVGLNDPLPFKLAIRGKDSLGRQGAVFYGDPALFQQPTLIQTLKLPEGEWILAAEPKGGWSALPENYWQQVVAIYGIATLVFLLLAAIIRFVLVASIANYKYRNLIQSSPVPYVLMDKQRRVTFINQAFKETFGYSLEDVESLPNWRQLIAQVQQQREKVKQDFVTELSHISSMSSAFEIEVETKSGKRRVVLVSSSIVENTFGDETLLVIYDITVRKEAEEQLRFSSRVFNQAHEAIMITDTRGVITDVNPAFCNITGYSREEAIGHTPHLLSSDKHPPEFFQNMWKSITEHGYWQGEVWNCRKNGELYAELLTVSSLTDDDGATRHFVGLFSDITQAKEQQDILELMAHYDVLTKLPNRVLFADRFSQAVAHCKRSDTMLAICFVDLDDFKPVNDTYGHDIGDQLLIEVANRLKSNVREEDTISRFGGDEFAIIFRDVESVEECEEMLKRIHQSIAQPYHVDDLRLNISASSGVSFYTQENDDLDTLLRHADQSMYQAKLSGRNHYQLFNPADNQLNIEKQQLLHDIRQGLQSNEFRLFYQPKVNMTTGEVFGMEALIRWQHPTRGLLTPLKFLPLIADSELEIEMGQWVLQQALHQLQLLHHAGYRISLSVNIASYHLQSAYFVENVEAILNQYPDISAEYLQLEIVETSALGDIGAITKVIRKCKDSIGVSVALDDFGTGYSSLTHLRHLNADTIKIDQSFIRDMLDDPQDYTIVDGVTGLAEAFNRQVIAEGVESVEHGLMLLLIGCENAQGYGIAKPMPSEELIPWLEQYHAEPQWLAAVDLLFSPRQKALRFLSLTLERWRKVFLNHFDENKDTSISLPWPIMDVHYCHCGTWIERVKNQNLFEESWVTELTKIHQEWHRLATQMREYALAENLSEAMVSVEQFEKIYQRLLFMINGVESVAFFTTRESGQN